MKILNLYAGIGGNRKLWGEDHQITAVELNPEIAKIYSNFFPNDEMVFADAHYYLLNHFKEYDFIWSSPPCQSHSRMMKATRHDVAKFPDLKLYEEIIFLQNFYKGKWVVENVKPYYKPLIEPTCIMGRHIFWSNFEFMAIEIKSPKGFITEDSTDATNKLKNWLGIYYEGNVYYGKNHSPGQVLRNAVHPLIGKHILDSIKPYITNKFNDPNIGMPDDFD